MKDTGIAMVLLLMVIPLVCFALSVLYGIKNAFFLPYALAVAILFVPSVFVFYNVTAWVYSPGYGVIALVGNLIGKLFYKPPRPRED